ncbi:sulfotransferase family protein [Sphingomonas sp.]|uniref:sulfotransferase family protein n=1 Tax=Sphingomonas sp. TaxID=28214 RepID=UPI0038A81648
MVDDVRPISAARNTRAMTEAHTGPRLPNLFIVGAPKCGTTAWAEYLRSHPDIFFPTVKDHCYFAFDLPNFRLTNTKSDYVELFRESGKAKVIGEASAMYLFSKAAADAIRQHDPDAKILIFLRDQEDYLPSLHNQFLWEFAEEIEDFEVAWRLSGGRPHGTVPAQCLEPATLDYAAMGRFREQVERFLANFPAEQVRVFRFRDWVADPRATYLEILEFLGLQDDGRSAFPPVNQGTTYQSRILTRLIVSPPTALRRSARLIKKVTGPLGRQLHRLALRAARQASAPGYKKISPELREEIEHYYAEDNRLLDERLQRSTAP